VLFDRICREHDVRHLLTAPRSPTTTGKVERFHRTLRTEFLAGRTFASLEEAQAELDAWVASYNAQRPHQSLGMATPAARFALAARRAAPAQEPAAAMPKVPEADPRAVTRRVGRSGKISLCGELYHVGTYLAGETVDLELTEGLVHVSHRGVLVASHARRRPPVVGGQQERAAGAAHTPRALPRRDRLGGPSRRHHRLRELRRHRLLARDPAPRPAGRGAARGRHGRDPARRPAAALTAGEARPLQGARRLLDSERTTTSQERGTALRSYEWNRGGGAKLEHGWWDLTRRRLLPGGPAAAPREGGVRNPRMGRLVQQRETAGANWLRPTGGVRASARCSLYCYDKKRSDSRKRPSTEPGAVHMLQAASGWSHCLNRNRARPIPVQKNPGTAQAH